MAAPVEEAQCSPSGDVELEACSSKLRQALEQLEAVYAELQRHNGGYGAAVTAAGELARPAHATP